MQAAEFLKQVRHDDLVAAIHAAEKLTSGEIRVFISRHDPADPLAAAQAQFDQLNMRRTRHRNGVLIFVAPLAQKFAVIGDEGVHACCGPEFWQHLAYEMTAKFKQGAFTEGLLHAVAKAGELLAKHLPRQSDDQNELPDTIARD